MASSLPAGRRTVTFRSTIGSLASASVEADGSNVARTTLTSLQLGTARITATVDGSSAETTADFTTSLPDRLFVSPSAVELKPGGSTSIRVTLLKNNGAVSPRLEVTYSAVTGAGAPIVGAFSSITLADGGISTATFNVPANATVPDTVTIAASIPGVTPGTATVRIVP